ncbi:MAG: AglZ/HisF2 family acetamidino modification protein [Ferruginibacter sp.]|nr:imidazole glycerol phosphate synthase subunit HisF [Chitinophagaceae bacterium]
MARTRVIPVLLIQNEGLVKGVQFKNHRYVGDPINAVKIFNEKEVDELCVLDISATINNKKPDIKRIADIVSEAFMPISYGGGVTQLDEAKALLYSGVEKILLNTALHTYPNLITEIANSAGNQSAVASIDVKKNIWGKYKVYTRNGTKDTGKDVLEFAKECENKGAGEILLNSIEKDGMCNGYDTELIKKVAQSVQVPLVAAGGAWQTGHLVEAKRAGASALAAGSMFVFHGKHKAVLISYLNNNEIKDINE